MTDPYPVLSEKTFAPPARRLLRPARRPISDLPERPPGSVYVFEIDGSYQVRSGGHITETEGMFVNATAVSVVQTRPRELPADIAVPSANPADDFTVRAWFRCEVSDAATVAANGPVTVPALLVNYLRRDPSLLVIAQRLDVEELSVVREKVSARVRAYCDLRTPQLAGITASLTAVEVLTPPSWRGQSERLRDAAWANDVANVLARHEDDEVKRLADYLTQPEMVAALGVHRDKVNLGEIISGAYSDRRTRDSNILELLKLLEKNGQLDRAPVDARLLIDALANRVAGIETLGVPGQIAASERLTAGPQPALADGPDGPGPNQPDGPEVRDRLDGPPASTRTGRPVDEDERFVVD